MTPTLVDVIARLVARGIELPAIAVGLGWYGDSKVKSDQLVRLICGGSKRATSSLYWAYEHDGEELSKPGDVEIVIDYDGSPAAFIRFTDVGVVPFGEVSAEFAAAEGEGDGSLEGWRREHWDFFSRECNGIGRTPDETMPVVCCNFELVRELRGPS